MTNEGLQLKLKDLLLKLKDVLLTVMAITVGLILAWYWAIKNVAWGLPVINLALLCNLAIAFYIPALVWGVLRGDHPGRWLITVPIAMIMHFLFT